MSRELHGFSDASETAYAGAVYLRAVDSTNGMHVSVLITKTKVEPIKRLTILHLELNGVLVAARLLHHCRSILHIPLSSTFEWTDSTTVLNWLCGDLSRFKPFVGNCVVQIVELIQLVSGGMFLEFPIRQIEHPEVCFRKIGSLRDLVEGA